MPPLLNLLSTLFDLALVILGFGFIVFVHELGHFLAARWAGIRVLAFALGFGPAALSYRKGMGWTRGSTEAKYLAMKSAAQRGVPGVAVDGLSPTEYRLNWLPFGGYVKMLGQEDANPGAVSDAPDSYQRCPAGKRMVVISAGVIMNVILAAALFVIVFMAGLKAMPPKIGDAAPGSPAARAVALNAADLGVREPGLAPGDEIVRINGRTPNSFQDLVMASSLSGLGEPVVIEVRREGITGTLTFAVTPESSSTSGLREIGVEPARSATIVDARSPDDRAKLADLLAAAGLPGLEPGSTILRAGPRAVRGAGDVMHAFRDSAGAPVEIAYTTTDGRDGLLAVRPRAELDESLAPMGKGAAAPFEHVLGLTPVMMVAGDGAKQGLAKGDIFARIGAIEYPSLPAGMAEIRAHARRPLDLTVLRRGDDGTLREVTLKAEVSGDGRVGFIAGTTADLGALLALPPSILTTADARGQASSAGANDQTKALPASRVVRTPGLTIESVAGTPVSDLGHAREALKDVTRAAFAAGQGAVVPMRFRGPRGESSDAEWSLSTDEVATLHALGWRAPFSQGVFEMEEFLLRASSPFSAVSLGIAETHRVMMSTYATFARLFDGGVKIEHLKGPVGIAHFGTLIAERGFVWLLFFMGLISVNLAVINFLPLPIVDGGQFLFLVYEAIRGRPAPIAFQNWATLAGLVLIGSLFLIVTFNDLRNLLGL
ncbi:MAG: site-2 protease family protein [Phycisphaeraceae bacterium]|nr:MAG: site-2 protease family protein [Phycisphaeraceae bacterium]